MTDENKDILAGQEPEKNNGNTPGEGRIIDWTPEDKSGEKGSSKKGATGEASTKTANGASTANKTTGETATAPAAERHPIWIDILAIVGVFLAAQIVAAIMQMIILKTGSATEEFANFVGYTFAVGATIIFALWQRSRRGDERPLLKLSLKRSNPSLILWGFLLVLATSLVLEPLLDLFPSEYLDLLKKAVGTGGWAMVTTIVCAPILEEILFRGVIQEAVTRRCGGVRGVLVAAAIFGIIHIVPQQAINAFFIGIVLGYIYIRTRSLLPVILIHAMNNALAFLSMVFFPDRDMSLHSLIGNPTLYWILYAFCAALLVLSSFNVYRQLRAETPRAA